MKNRIGNTIMEEFEDLLCCVTSELGMDQTIQEFEDRIKHAGMSHEAIDFYLEDLRRRSDGWSMGT